MSVNRDWPRNFKFRKGQYFRANVCGDNPVAKVLRVIRFSNGIRRPPIRWLISIKWDRGKDRIKCLRYKEAQVAYSVSGPIEEVPRILGMVLVGE